MKKGSLKDRSAVCSWSLQPEGPAALLDQLGQIGVPRLQIALDPIRTQPSLWGSIAARCRVEAVEMVSGMFITAGEDYSSLESIRRTGGVVPDSTWEENWKNIRVNADLARDLNLRLVTFHAGFLPEDPDTPEFEKLSGRLEQIADHFAERGLNLGLETGQESASSLIALLTKLNRSNVGVNFDPANMILYDKGDPIEALRLLGPWLKQCHLKDANRTRLPGQWGEEVAVSQGEVDWPAFFRVLDEVGFRGDLAIEREAGQQRLADIRTARQFVETL
jgi:L-ribulose-5-phosphate 3-epimerase